MCGRTVSSSRTLWRQENTLGLTDYSGGESATCGDLSPHKLGGSLIRPSLWRLRRPVIGLLQLLVLD